MPLVPWYSWLTRQYYVLSSHWAISCQALTRSQLYHVTYESRYLYSVVLQYECLYQQMNENALLNHLMNVSVKHKGNAQCINTWYPVLLERLTHCIVLRSWDPFLSPMLGLAVDEGTSQLTPLDWCTWAISKDFWDLSLVTGGLTIDEAHGLPPVNRSKWGSVFRSVPVVGD